MSICTVPCVVCTVLHILHGQCVCTVHRSVRELCIQHEPHDFLTHLPPPPKAERELDRRFELLSSDSKYWRNKCILCVLQFVQ